MAALTVQEISRTGVEVTLAAAGAGGDTFVNDGKTFFKIANASGGSINVTFDSQVDCNQGFDHDVVVAVADGETLDIGAFPTNRFNTSAGVVSVSYSAVTSVTVAAVRLSLS